MFKAIPTLNRCGHQMGTPTPLLQDWLSSYDGQHPLLDVGCAYGINTFKALELGIPTVCIDPEEKHLEILRQNLDPKYRHLLTCVAGELPDNIYFPDSYFSGILCADVLHFLDGTSIEKALGSMNRKLIQKGKLVMTMVSEMFLGYVDKSKQAKFYQDLENGIKWPGEIRTDDDFKTKFKKIIQSDEIRSEIDDTMGNIIHFCSIEQLTEELHRRGFAVLHAKLGDHPGHPDPGGHGTLPGRSLHVVAQKH